MVKILIKRVYERPEKTDGFRILADRLWPRGLTKEMLPADVWIKGIAPSPVLRIWFNHNPGNWEAFSKAYLIELKKANAVYDLLDYCKNIP